MTVSSSSTAFADMAQPVPDGISSNVKSCPIVTENLSPTRKTLRRPLVRRPHGTSYKTLLSVDGGGVRGIVSTMVLIELERSIKQYLLEHPELLPSNAAISRLDDFDINLADYFDCMTGVSAGSWSTMYLGTRGGKGASRAVLDDPEIVQRYGRIPDGGAEGLRVFYKEYSAKIYPAETVNLKTGTPFDMSNPQAPGVSTPLYSLSGLEDSLEAFLGKTTLKDIDTSLLAPALDLASGVVVYFVQNAFRDPPATSCAKLFSRYSPRLPARKGEKVAPDLVFDEGKDYCLKDIGAASGAVPTVQPAKPLAQAGSDAVEFQLVDGAMAVENTDFPAALFVSNEAALHSFDKLAIFSVGTGRAEFDRSFLKNAGIAKWSKGLNTISVSYNYGNCTMTSLMDYMYFNNPNTKPYQYLRVSVQAPITTDDGVRLKTFTQAEYVHDLEKIGLRCAQEHRHLIDLFVRDFIFA